MERNVHFPHVSVACTVTASPLPQSNHRMGCNEESLGDTFCSELFVGRRTNLFNVHGSMHLKNILIYIQQDATLHSLFYLETALHVSGGTTTHHQERKQLNLQHLVFVGR